MINYGFIYKWTRLSTGQYYIGQHRGPTTDKYKGSGTQFKRIFNNTDISDWAREILILCRDNENLGDMESYAIGQLYELDPLCLNGQQGGRNARKSSESRRKMSEAAKGKKHTDETKHNMSESKMGNTNSKGYKHTDETKRNMSESRKGMKFSEEHKRNMSESGGNRRGIKPSEETKRRMSAHQKGTGHWSWIAHTYG